MHVLLIFWKQTFTIWYGFLYLREVKEKCNYNVAKSEGGNNKVKNKICEKRGNKGRKKVGE